VLLFAPLLRKKALLPRIRGSTLFWLSPKANKVEIAEAVSYIFDVDVQRVRIINRPAKFGRWGRKRVKRQAAQKKAIVTLPPGQRIEAFEGV
jgi:large subunit ribosomal protein L23